MFFFQYVCVQHSGLHRQRFSHNPGLLSMAILLSSNLVLPRCGQRQSLCAWLRCCEQGAHAGVRGLVHATRRCFLYVLVSWTFRVGKKQTCRCWQGHRFLSFAAAPTEEQGA